MLFSVQFETYSGRWGELSDSEYARLRTVVPTLAPEKGQYGDYKAHVVDREAMRVIADLKLAVTMHEDDGTATMLTKLQDKIDALEMKSSTLAEQAMAGAVVQITIPDLALMYITEVMNLDNACTDDVQSHLDAGWRILAVCPPNAQRRPDYILGRWKDRNG